MGFEPTRIEYIGLCQFWSVGNASKLKNSEIRLKSQNRNLNVLINWLNFDSHLRQIWCDQQHAQGRGPLCLYLRLFYLSVLCDRAINEIQFIFISIDTDFSYCDEQTGNIYQYHDESQWTKFIILNKIVEHIPHTQRIKDMRAQNESTSQRW